MADRDDASGENPGRPVPDDLLARARLPGGLGAMTRNERCTVIPLLAGDAAALPLLIDRFHEADDYRELEELAEALAAHPGGRATLLDALRAAAHDERTDAVVAWLDELRARGVSEGRLCPATPDTVEARRRQAAVAVLPVDAETRPLYVAALSALDFFVRRQAFWALQDDESTGDSRLSVAELVSLIRAEARYGVWKSAFEAIDLLSRREGGLRELVLAAEGVELPTVASLLRRVHARAYRDGRAAEGAWELLRGMLRHPDGRARAVAAVMLVRHDGNDAEAMETLRDALRGEDATARSDAIRLLVSHDRQALKRLQGDPDPAVRAAAAEAIDLARRNPHDMDVRFPAGR